MRYAYAITTALLLGGAATTVLSPSYAQNAQNEPGTISAAAPKAGAPMSFADMVAKLQPAVVNISTKQKVQVSSGGNPFGDLFGGLLGQQGQDGRDAEHRDPQVRGGGGRDRRGRPVRGDDGRQEDLEEADARGGRVGPAPLHRADLDVSAVRSAARPNERCEALRV